MTWVTPCIITLAQQTSPGGPGWSQTTLLLWAIVLIAAAATLFVVEVFVPSGGLIAGVSALCLVVGIVMLFGVNTYLGLATSTASLLALPFLLMFAMKLWPHTPIGRRLVLASDDQSMKTQESLSQEALLSVGCVGQAVTDLRPVGTGLFQGQRIECLADRGMILAGTAIQIIECQGMETKVKPVDPPSA